VENASLSGPNSLGSMYPISKWMFVGAKLSYEKREQQIKGVLAHELCHYVMRLVYENKEEPYYKDRKDMKEMFEEIVRAIDKWSAAKSRDPDDECNGIISKVFTLYLKEEFSPELIVRVVQILTAYADAEDKSKDLQDKYQDLFNFWYNQVVPELQIYLQKNKEVKKLNGFVELLPKILTHKIEVNRKNEVKEMIAHKLAIVTTNIPNLLFVNICKIQKEKDRFLMDSKNFFTESEKLNNLEVWKAFNQICRDVLELNIFVDCTKGLLKGIENIFVNKELNFIFIVSNESQCEKLMDIFNKKGIKDATKMEINYNWSDLTDESQKLLLQTEINFQNNSQIKMLDLLKVMEPSEEFNSEKHIIPDLTEVIDAQLLNMIIEAKEVSINSRKELDPNEKYSKFVNKSRTFLRKEKNKNNQSDGQQESKDRPKISQEKLLSEAENKKFVLISDIAGNGKSWAMKTIAKILYEKNPTRWVTYIDLKQYIQEFKLQKDETEFSTFMIEKILKPEQKFESRIFQRLYKDGKVFILFDGFDEIAPDCAECVSKLVQSFQSNEGNQMWIATRDYFEVGLQEKLKLDVSYGLDTMTNREGIDMIAKSWMLMDLIGSKKVVSVEEFNELIDDSTDFENYKEKAEQIIEKVEVGWSNSIGMPQMFKMIADGFKDETDVNNLARSKIYKKFVSNLYKRWSDEKGIIRKDASIESQQLELNFWRFHQYHAIKSLLPKLLKILFPGYDKSKWPVEEVIACGLMSIKDGEYFFLHKTFREYFAADALAKALANGVKQTKKILKVFAEILTLYEHDIVRVFLNDCIDSKTLKKFLPQMKRLNLCQCFNEFDSFSDLFTENLKNLAEFVILILKDRDYKIVKRILEDNSRVILNRTEDSKLFYKFQEFLCQFLKDDDLKELIARDLLLMEIIKGPQGIDGFANFVMRIESKTGRDLIQQELQKEISEGWMQEYFIDCFSRDSDPKNFRWQKLMKILIKFLSPTDILEFLKKKADRYEENILLACAEKRKPEIFKILWTEIENYFTSQSLMQDFKEFVKEYGKNNENILHKIARNENLEYHKFLWEFLLCTFEDRKELKDLILQKDIHGNKFFHLLICHNRYSEIIEWTFKMLKENFDDSSYQEFIQSREKDNRNILHNAALEKQSSIIFKFLFENFHNSCKSEQEFLEVLKEVDEGGKNILRCATWKSTTYIFYFLMEELEKNYLDDEIKKMLSSFDKNSRSLLHSEDSFKAVWRNLQKYLESAKILEIVKQVDDNEENFLFSLNSSNHLRQAIMELEKILPRDEIRNMLCSLNKKSQNILQNYAYNRKSGIFETLFQIIRNYFIDSEILNFIRNVDKDGNNLLHVAVSGTSNGATLDFIWNEIKTFMNRDEQTEYLKMKGKDGKNLVELAELTNKYSIKNWVKDIIDEYKIIF